MKTAFLIRWTVLAASLFALTGADLPDTIPVPVARPDRADSAVTPKDGTVAAPAAKEVQETTPVEPEETYVPPPLEIEDPAALKACLADLARLGVAFRPAPRIDEHNGCGIDQPIVVTTLGEGIALKPEATIRCETALALSRWTTGSVLPMLRTAMPEARLVEVQQASGYVCRKRNNAATGKISEHAHGNAIDIAGFAFASGKTFPIQPHIEDGTLDGAFQRAIAAVACLYFTTVLDPGSDKAHETHLHLDVITRKGGFRYCW